MRLRKKTSKTLEDHRDGVLDGGGGAKGGDVDGFTGTNGGGERGPRASAAPALEHGADALVAVDPECGEFWVKIADRDDLIAGLNAVKDPVDGAFGAGMFEDARCKSRASDRTRREFSRRSSPRRTRRCRERA